MLKITLKCHCDANPTAAGVGAAAADGNAAAAADAGEPTTDAGEPAADAGEPTAGAGAEAADSNVSARVAISLLDAPADDGDMAREIGTGSVSAAGASAQMRGRAMAGGAAHPAR